MDLLTALGQDLSLDSVFNPWSLIIAPLVLAAYLVILGVYRLYLHPIAGYPGPKLAALTTWYQAYYDIWLGGQFFLRIEEMHAQYGPVVRINPHELHFNAPDFVDEIYAGPSRPRDKDPWNTRINLMRQSIVSTIPHDLHRRRRAPMGKYFSKSNIRRLDSTIQENLAKFLERLENSRSSQEVIPLTHAFRALTCDIITSYSFGACSDFLSREDYNGPLWEAVYSSTKLGHWIEHIGWLGPLIEALPKQVIASMSPGWGSLSRLEDQWDIQIRGIQESKSYQDPRNCEKTILHGLLNSDLPDSEKAASRLHQEARLLFLAGTDGTAITLSTIIYHLLSNPSMLDRLKDELVNAMPDPDALPTGAQVGHLPYLTAIIQEGLRIRPPPVRQTRVAPNEELHFHTPDKDWVVPKGTPVTMTARLLQRHPDIFPDPTTFKPERWLGNPRLDKYLIAFSKGTRICLGMNLAYEEMYLVLASVFRKYDLVGGSDRGRKMALYETTERDIAMVADHLAWLPPAGSKEVRITVS